MDGKLNESGRIKEKQVIIRVGMLEHDLVILRQTSEQFVIVNVDRQTVNLVWGRLAI